ncbi:MAG TPA: folate-binding protein [Rhodanobacteraceae bacterium]|nr:folate-binding protein [Rhodanobacteraceae bacterium]
MPAVPLHDSDPAADRQVAHDHDFTLTMTDVPVSDELLAIGGADAIDFAHAQFTSDVQSLAPGRWQWSAWLDPQGRTRHFFALLRPEPMRLLVWLPLAGAADMTTSLARFVMRLKVELRVLDGWTSSRHAGDALTGSAGSDALLARDGGCVLTLPGPWPRIAVLTPRTSPGSDPSDHRHGRCADVLAGLPFLAPDLAGRFLPQTLDLERLDAIRFDKGCYPGQEIAARVHFRGGNKHRLVRLRLADGVAPVAGAQLLHAGHAVGTVLYGAPAPDGTAELLCTLAQSIVEPADLTVAPGHAVGAIRDGFRRSPDSEAPEA